MTSNGKTVTGKKPKPRVLGRSAATGRFVMAPAVVKKGSVSDQQIAAAVKSVFAAQE